MNTTLLDCLRGLLGLLAFDLRFSLVLALFNMVLGKTLLPFAFMRFNPALTLPLFNLARNACLALPVNLGKG